MPPHKLVVVDPTHPGDESVPREDWEPPKEFDGYLLQGCIGKGAMGRVYRAQDAVLDRPVAIKFIDAVNSGWYQQERFLVEARAIARLQHPNVVAIYRIGEVGGFPYIASEFVHGDRLDEIKLPVSGDLVLRIALGLAKGLEAAHLRGVVHRDIKPANVILSEGSQVKLLDFGLAKLVEASGPSLLNLKPASPSPPVATPAPAPRMALKAVALSTAPLDPKDIDRTRELQLRASTEGAAKSLTLHGAVLGTPGYIAPEVWLGEPATFQSDVYSAGAVLYRLCTGSPPYEGRSLEELRAAALAQEPKSLSDFGSVEPRLARIIQRCLHRDPQLRYASGEELREALEALAPERREASLPEGNPYRGLRAFEAEHRSLFFGRDMDIRTILDRLRSDPFVLVVGPSGVGKSSLCRAGVLPRAADLGLGEERKWSVVTLTPGKRPLQALAAALAPYWGADEETLAEGIRTDWKELYRELRRRQKERGPLLLFMDQLEELVTLADAGEAEVMAQILEGLSAAAPGLRLLATIRADFLVRVASLPGLWEEMTRAAYLLRPLAAEGVREAIVGPARAKGVVFASSQMVKELVDATVQAEGALPLLQFVLAQLWDARDSARSVIPESALAVSGGVNGALARHADEVLAGLPSDQRTAARRILLDLVTLEGTRARQTEKELGGESPQYRSALAALVRGRLLTATESPEGARFEVAHEALIRSWPTLRRWLDEYAEERVLRERLTTAISEWVRLGQKNEALWSGRQLAEAAPLNAAELLPREKVFLDASRRALRLRRRVWVGSVTLACLGLVGAYSWMRLKASRDLTAKINALVREGSSALDRARARESEVEALRKQAFVFFDGRQPEGGERVWAQGRLASNQVDDLYVTASGTLEAALNLGNGSARARELLADALYERAVLADRDGNGIRDELIKRLRVYDDGTRMSRWMAPAKLTIELRPALTQVILQRYQEREAQNPGLVDDTVLQSVPIQVLERPPGSYLLIARAPGRSTVRLPILLRRGESRLTTLDLPREADVPAGFVYLPPGRFLFGSLADDNARLSFLRSVPLHEVTSGSYLIARHETTYGDWLEYLSALPPGERPKRAPSIATSSWVSRGALGLKQMGKDWVLSLELGGKKHRLRLGEPLRLAERETRQLQDWRQLPVGGITAADAEGYVHWLDTSGRIPGARLCSEREWERAGRGADGRDYPHGNYLNPSDANFDETYSHKSSAWGPDEVGQHPASRSPFDIDDMSGNVWELTHSDSSEGEYVARGGDYSEGRMAQHLSNREVVPTTFKDMTLGVRVCATISP